MLNTPADKYQPYPPLFARPLLAGATYHARATLALYRSARRQSGAGRADGQHAQAAVLGADAELWV